MNWRPIKNAPTSEWVLGTAKDNPNSMVVVFGIGYQTGKKKYVEWLTRAGSSVHNLTHWMPLPEPPA